MNQHATLMFRCFILYQSVKMAFITYIIMVLFINISAVSLLENPMTNENFFEGDIMGVDSDTILQLVAATNHHELISGGIIGHGGAIGIPSAVWPEGKVYFELSNEFNSTEVALIESAFEEFHQHTCIRLIKRTNQNDYVLIVKGFGCWAYIGRKRGLQHLSLGSDCFKKNAKGLIIHEVMHAVGFFHEHTRWDRDDYVKIVWPNIINESIIPRNFLKYELDAFRNLHTDYDYNSIMHYESNAFGINGAQTIVPLKAGAQIGQRRGLSEIDKKEINLLYNCNRSASTKATTRVPNNKDKIRWGVRFVSHYFVLFVNGSEQCINHCKQNISCDAITFDSGNTYSNRNCFMFKSAHHYKSKLDPTKQWGIWEKNQTISVYTLEHEICWGTRFFGHYGGYFAQNPAECVSRCKANFSCDAITFDLHSTYSNGNCFFFNWAFHNYESRLDSNLVWGSWKKDKTTFECKQQNNIHWGVRFMRHYYSYRAPNPEDCFNYCLQDFHCAALSFDKGNTYPENCFFFNPSDKYVSHWDPTKQWGIWERNKTSLQQRRLDEICWGTRFFGHYWSYFANSSDECIQSCLQNVTCQAITFDSGRTFSNGNCFYFDSGKYPYESRKDPNYQWGAWKKNRTTFECKSEIRFGTRFNKHYLAFHANNPNECIKKCIRDVSCDAITFNSGSAYNNDNCFFLNSDYKYYSTKDLSSKWGIWEKNKTRTKQKRNPIRWGLRLKFEYASNKTKNAVHCKQKCELDNECDAMSFQLCKTPCDVNCYFFKADDYFPEIDLYHMWGTWKKVE